MIKIAVIGSRSLNYPLVKRHIWEVLDNLREEIGDFIVVSGGAIGPDSFAKIWAIHHNLEVEIFLPDYKKYHPKKAPLERNKKIAESCDRLLCWWDGESGGSIYTYNLVLNKKPTELFTTFKSINCL